MRRPSMCGFWSFTCGAIPFLLFTLRVLSFSSLSVLLPRGGLCPASLLPEFRSALFPLRPLARHLMPVVPFGGIFAAGSLNVHCAGYYPAFFFLGSFRAIQLPAHSAIRQPLADVPASLLPPQGKNRGFKHSKGGDKGVIRG